jgi:peptidyl-prolyl cis-trans isomerase C
MHTPDKESTGAEIAGTEAGLRALLLARAAALGIAAGEGESGEAAAIEALLEREVVVPEASEAECRRHYERHAARYASGELAFARHILFAVTPGAPLDLIRRKAELTLSELQLDPARFAALAAECSNCPSGAQGGNLGQLGRGDTVPEFERALFEGGSTGLLPRLVATRYGFHIVAVDRREAGRQLPFETVRAQVAARLQRKALERALAQYLQVLGGAPLVQ